METNKKEERSKTIELTVEYTESDLYSTIEIDPDTKLSDIKTTTAIFEKYDFLSKMHSIGRENLKFPPSIYVKLDSKYLENMTVAKATNTFGRVIISIPSFGAPLANEAAKVRTISEANFKLSEFHEKTVIPSIQAMVEQQNAKESATITQHVNEGKIFRACTVSEMLEKLHEQMDTMVENHRKDIEDLKQSHRMDMKQTHDSRFAG